MNSSVQPLRAVLVIEDDTDVAESLRDILEEHGYRVVVAFNGRDALAYLRGAPAPDVILTDLWMPVMNGWAFVEAVHELSSLAGVPVVVATGSGDGVSPPPCDALLSKPFGVKRLLDTIEAVCRKARAAQAVCAEG